MEQKLREAFSAVGRVVARNPVTTAVVGVLLVLLLVGGLALKAAITDDRGCDDVERDLSRASSEFAVAPIEGPENDRALQAISDYLAEAVDMGCDINY